MNRGNVHTIIRKGEGRNFMWKTFLIFVSLCFLIFNYNTALGAGHEKDIIIEQKEVTKVELELIFVAGKLTLSGGAKNLMEGKFLYQEKEPKIVYDPLGDHGYLYMEQRNEASVKKRSVWNVLLHRHIPLAMHIATGGSEAKLDFRDITIEKLLLENGVGDTVIYLNGNYQTGFESWIHGGVGNIKIILPKDIGVIVKTKNDRGTIKAKDFIEKEKNIYVNEQYGKAGVLIDVEVTMGIGEVELVLANNH